MKLSIGDKAQRVLTLLMAIRNPKVLKKLMAHGFSQADLDEGWRLLHAVADVKLSAPPDQEQAIDPLEVRRLDDWENKWFPIVSASLRRRFPELHEQLFLNLTQTEGPGVIISVGTLLARLKEFEKNAESKAARKLLESRGVTKTVLADGQDMVDKFSSFAEDSAIDSGIDEQEADAAQARAVEAMWDWYLEWSEIARSAIQSRSLLRTLGFLRTRKPGERDSDERVAVAGTPPSDNEE